MAKILDPDDLTYSVNSATNNLRFDTTAKTIELVAGGSLVAIDGVTGQCIFSKIKEVIKASSVMISTLLPVREMIHDESMELINGWTFKDTSTLKMIRDCGVAYIATNGAPTAKFACFVTLGAILTGAPYYTLSNADNASTATFTHVNTGLTFGVNELVQFYSDTSAGVGSPEYNYDTYAKVFLRVQGYTYDEASNIDIGYPVLTYKKYNFPITHAVDVGVTVDDTTVDAYTGMDLTWYAAAQSASLGANGPYNFHVLITTAGHTHDEIYSWVQRQLRKATDIDAGAGTKNGNVTPALVFMDGAILKTLLQPSGGIHLVNPSATSYNYISEADDTGAYRTYPLSVSVLCEFDSYLEADATSYFWVFTTATYGIPSSTPVLDTSSAEMKGAANIPSASFAYNWTTNVPITGIALGTDGAKIAVATGVITNTGAKLVFVAGQERWYSNP